MRHSDSPSLPRAEPGINGLTSWLRKLSRFSNFTQPNRMPQERPVAVHLQIFVITL